MSGVGDLEGKKERKGPARAPLFLSFRSAVFCFTLGLFWVVYRVFLGPAAVSLYFWWWVLV